MPRGFVFLRTNSKRSSLTVSVNLLRFPLQLSPWVKILGAFADIDMWEKGYV
jgi:hypothetical protein